MFIHKPKEPRLDQLHSSIHQMLMSLLLLTLGYKLSCASEFFWLNVMWCREFNIKIAVSGFIVFIIKCIHLYVVSSGLFLVLVNCQIPFCLHNAAVV